MAQLQQQYQQQLQEQLAFQGLPEQDNYHNKLKQFGKQYSGTNQEILWIHEENNHDAEGNNNSNGYQDIPGSQLHNIQGQTIKSSEIIHSPNEGVSNCNHDCKIYKKMKNKGSFSTCSQNTTHHTSRQRASMQQHNQLEQESLDESEDQDNQQQQDDGEEEKQMMQPNFLEFCTFCQKLNGYDSFNQLLNKALYQKYPLSQNKFYARGVEEILRGESTSLVIKFRDEECYEIDDEYLKRFYPRGQQFQKMFDLTAYYKYHKDIPRLFMQSIGNTMTYYHEHRRKIEYRKIKKQLNLENKEDQTESELMSEEESEQDNEQENEGNVNNNERNTGEKENTSDKNTNSQINKDKKSGRNNKNKDNKVLPKECEHVLENIDMTLSFHQRISQQQQQLLNQDTQQQIQSKGYKLTAGGVANNINAYYFFCQNETKKQELADGFDAESFIRKPSNLHFKPQLKKGEILLSQQLVNQQNNITNNNCNASRNTSSYSLSQLLQNQQSLQSDLSVSQMNQLLFTEQSSDDSIMIQAQQAKNQYNINVSQQQESQNRLLQQIQFNHHHYNNNQDLQMLNFNKVKNMQSNNLLGNINMMNNNNLTEQAVLSQKLKQQQYQQDIVTVSNPFQSSVNSSSLQSKTPSLGQLISKSESAQISLPSTQLQGIQPQQPAIQKSQLKQQQYPQRIPLISSEGYQQQQQQPQIPQTKLSSLILEQQQKHAEINLPYKNSGAQAASAAIARLTQQANQLAALKSTGEQSQQQQFLLQSQLEAMRNASNERENNHLIGNSSNPLREQQQSQHILQHQMQYQREHTNPPFHNTSNFPATDQAHHLQLSSPGEPLNYKDINIIKGTLNNTEIQHIPNSNSSTLRNHSNDPSLQNSNAILLTIRNNSKLSSTTSNTQRLIENNQDQQQNNFQPNQTGSQHLQRIQNDNLGNTAKITLSMTARQPGSSVLRSQPQFNQHSRAASGNATPDNNNTNNLQLLQQQQLLILQQRQQQLQQQQQQQQQPKLLITDTIPNNHSSHAFSQTQSDQQLQLSLKQNPVIVSSLSSSSSKVPLNNNTTNSTRYAAISSSQSQGQYSAGSSLPSSSGGTPAHAANMHQGEARLKKKKEGIVLNNSNCNGSSGGVSLINAAGSSYKNNQVQSAVDASLQASNTKIQPVIMNKGLNAGVLNLHSDRNNQGRRGWGSLQQEQQQQQQTQSQQGNNLLNSQRTASFQQSIAATNSAFFNAKRNSTNNNNNILNPLNPENRQEFLAMSQLPYSSPNSSSFFASNQKNRSASNYQKQSAYSNNTNNQESVLVSSQVKHQNFVGASAQECAVNLQQLLKASQNRADQFNIGSTSNNNSISGSNARLKNNSQLLLNQQQQQELLLLNKPTNNISMHQRIVSSQSSHAASSSSIQQPLTQFSQAAALQQYSQLLQHKQASSQSQSLSSSLLNKNNTISPFNSSPMSQTHGQQQQLGLQQFNQLSNQHQDSESNVQMANGRTRSQEIISRNTNHNNGVHTARNEYEQNIKNYPYPATQRHPILNSSDQNTPQLTLLQQSQLATSTTATISAGLKPSNNPSKERITSSSQSSSSANFAESIKRLISQNIHTVTSKGSSTQAALSSMQQQKILSSHPQQFQLSMAQPSPQPQVSSYPNSNNTIAQSSSPSALKKYNNITQASSNSQRSKLITTTNGNHTNNGLQQQQHLSSLVRINPQSSNCNSNTLNNLCNNPSALTSQHPPYQQQQQPSSQLTNSMVNHNYSVPSQILEHLRQQSTQLLSQTARPSLNTPISRNSSPPQKLQAQQSEPQFFIQQKQPSYEQDQYSRQFQQQQQYPSAQQSINQMQLQHQQQQRFQQAEKLQPSYTNNSNYAVNNYTNRLPNSSLSVHQPASVAQNLQASQSRPSSTQRAATKQMNTLVRFRQNQQQQ